VRGLYDQIVEQAAAKTVLGCRSCGCTDFYHWWLSWEATGISEPRLETWVPFGSEEPITGLVWGDFGTSRGGEPHHDDSGDEFWCADCEDHAHTLEELLGLEEARETRDTRIRTVF